MTSSETVIVTLEGTFHWGLGFTFIVNDFWRKGSYLPIQANKYNVNTKKVQENVQMLVNICYLM